MIDVVAASTGGSTAPWWAVPGGVIVGALIAFAATLYTTRRRRVDEAAASQAARDQAVLDEQRLAAVKFIAASLGFRNSLARGERDEQLKRALHELDDSLAAVRVCCSTDLSGQAHSISLRATFAFICIQKAEWKLLEDQLSRITELESELVNLARELAGYPPVDKQALEARRQNVGKWIEENMPEDAAPTHNNPCV